MESLFLIGAELLQNLYGIILELQRMHNGTAKESLRNQYNLISEITMKSLCKLLKITAESVWNLYGITMETLQNIKKSLGIIITLQWENKGITSISLQIVTISLKYHCEIQNHNRINMISLRNYLKVTTKLRRSFYEISTENI